MSEVRFFLSSFAQVRNFAAFLASCESLSFFDQVVKPIAKELVLRPLCSKMSSISHNFVGNGLIELLLLGWGPGSGKLFYLCLF